MSESKLRLFQEDRLRKLVRHAYKQVPFYGEKFKAVGVHPMDIKQLSDLKNIPVCERNELIEAGEEKTLARNVDPRRCHEILTSGSGGTPLKVYVTRRELASRKMVELRGLLRIGFKPRDRLLVLGPEGSARSSLFQRLLLYNTKQVSPFLSVEDQLAQIYQFKPTILWIYPTILRALLHASDGSLSRIAQPRIVITSAEQLDPTVRQNLREDLDTEVFNFYASMETGRIATECRSHQGLHVNADQLILEIPHEGSAPSGGVLVTCLNAYTMPFIRYRLGDVTAFKDGKCTCGSNFPIIDPPQGRRDALIQLPSGGRRSFVVFFQILRRFGWIRQFRVVQKAPDHVLVFLRLLRKPRPAEFSTIRVLLTEYLGETAQLDFHVVEELPGRNIKFSSFRSELQD